MIENLSFNSGFNGGELTAELIDASTGKVVQKEIVHNSLTVGWKAWLTNVFLSNATRNAQIAERLIINYRDYSPFEIMRLTDDDKQVAPTECFQSGKTIGWANRSQTYSGTDTFRGSINQSESTMSDNKLKIVFDFPTNAANGTIKSACFYNSFNNYGYTLGVPFSYSYKIFDRVNTIYNLCSSGDFLYYINNKNLMRYPGHTIVKTNFCNSNYLNGLFCNGSNFYSVDYDGKITKYDIDGNLLGTTTLQNASCVSVCFDGEYFYVFFATSASYNATSSYNHGIAKVNLSGNIVKFINCGDQLHKSLIGCQNGKVLYATSPSSYDSIINIVDFTNDNISKITSVDRTNQGSSGFTLYKGAIYYANGTAVRAANHNTMCSRMLLPAPIVKTADKILKITYVINFESVFQ